jgi:hypothetical protein
MLWQQSRSTMQRVAFASVWASLCGANVAYSDIGPGFDMPLPRRRLEPRSRRCSPDRQWRSITRPVRILVGYSAGGLSDILAAEAVRLRRAAARSLSRLAAGFGRPTVVGST